MSRRIRWHGPKCARLGLLVGQNYTPEQIAADPFIRSTPEAVRRQAARLDLVFKERPAELVPAGVMPIFDAAGVEYNMTGKQLLQTFIRAAANEPIMIHNVCDMRK